MDGFGRSASAPAPDEEMVREHSKELGDHIIDVIHEVAGDVSPEDLPEE